MSSFIAEVVDHVTSEFGGRMDKLTVVFPNRRAGLFFRKIMGESITKPAWMPQVYSMEDFMLSLTSIEKVETIEAVFQLYESYRKVHPAPESFDKFYFWGEMILRDFEEIDQYRVNPRHLFTSIKSQKELDEAFYFLTDEELENIRMFWSTFLPEATKTQQSFMATWKVLLPLYEDFKKNLLGKGKGYGGMIYEAIVARLEAGQLNHDRHILFAGFNALTGTEEAVFKHFLKAGNATIMWDCDAWYMKDYMQESGYFLRQYAADPVLGKSFPKEPPARIQLPKEINLTGVSLEIGQTKLLAEKLSKLVSSPTFVPEKTVVVLPKEHLLFPVLNALPPDVHKVNITMGYPLKETPVYTLIESLLSLQQTIRTNEITGIKFYHRPTLEVLEHPIIMSVLADDRITAEKTADFRGRNLVYIFPDDLTFTDALLQKIFSHTTHLLDYLLDILQTIYDRMLNLGHDLEMEFVSRFYMHLSSLKEIIGQGHVQGQVDFLVKLFRKVSRSLKIPFTGEPLQGLQIMGILETRNLDFDHVIILDMNEDAWPSAPRQGSFIPYNIRKAFGLPVQEHQDAIFAYLFYRLLQRAKSVDIYYNTVSEFNINGDLSRFVKQLMAESELPVTQQLMSPAIQVRKIVPITIPKTQTLINQLARFTTQVEGKHMRRITPSALDTYLNCRLQFYFKYVEQIYEPDQLSEQLDAASFGTIVHHAMEILYDNNKKRTKRKGVLPEDFFWLKAGVSGAVNKAFIEHYHVKNEKKFSLEGRNLIAADMVNKMVNRILDIDEKYAPFDIIGLEASSREGYKCEVSVQHQNEILQVRIKGIIDRIDKKGDVVRIIDYKTGRDERNFSDLPSLSDRENTNRKKAAFQLMFYSYLYKTTAQKNDERIEPGLYNMKDLFSKDFDWKLQYQKNPLLDYSPLHDAFSAQLEKLIREIWDMSVPFDQTTDENKCKFCAYKEICQRGSKEG